MVLDYVLYTPATRTPVEQVVQTEPRDPAPRAGDRRPPAEPSASKGGPPKASRGKGAGASKGKGASKGGAKGKAKGKSKGGSKGKAKGKR